MSLLINWKTFLRISRTNTNLGVHKETEQDFSSFNVISNHFFPGVWQVNSNLNCKHYRLTYSEIGRILFQESNKSCLPIFLKYLKQNTDKRCTFHQLFNHFFSSGFNILKALKTIASTTFRFVFSPFKRTSVVKILASLQKSSTLWIFYGILFREIKVIWQTSQMALLQKLIPWLWLLIKINGSFYPQKTKKYFVFQTGL